MDNLSGKDFLITLNCLDIETEGATSESLDWLFDKKDTSDILTWLCTYINENNIETCNEIQKINTLDKERKKLPEHYIDNICKSNTMLDDICNVSEAQVSSLKREIDIAKLKAESLNQLTTKYLILESQFNRNIEDNELNMKIKRDSYLTECIEASKEVDKLHKNFYERIETFSHIFSNYNMMKDKCFISQMPLHKYQQQNEIFQTNLHLWIRKNFETSSFTYTNDDVDNIDNVLNKLYTTISNCIMKHVQAECNEKEMKAKLNYFRNNTYTELSDEHRRVQEIQYTSRINILYNDLETLYTNDLQQVSEKFTKNLINAVLIKNAENKLERSRDVLKTLRNLNTEIIQALAQYELMFLLLKTDKAKLRFINKFLEDLYFYSSNYLKSHSLKTQLMNEIEYNVAKQEFEFKEIISIFSENFNNEPINIKSVICDVEKQKVMIENLENDLFIIKNQKYINEAKKVEKNIMSIKECIFCGPTSQAVIIPYEYLDNLYITNSQLEKVKKYFKSVMENLNEIRTSTQKNTWATHRRLLWVWFLMKPEKIPVIIEQLKDFITEKARSNT